MRAKTLFHQRKLLGIVSLVFLVVILLASVSSAQIYQVPNDTLKILDASGQPGDSTIWVSIYLKNSDVAGGFSVRLRYDQNLIVPRETVLVITPDSSETLVVAEPTGRTLDPDTLDFLAFASGKPGTGLVTLLAVFNILPHGTSNLPDTLPPGAGPVARIQFKVNPAITRDTSTVIRFENDPEYPYAYNIFVDKSAMITYVPTLTNGTFTITTGGIPGNHSPVFGPLASQFTVTEGQTLAFTVSASDEDGDTVTLSADALPPNATFPTSKGDSVVSQTFSFSPDFTQGPDTISITFRARDEHGASSLKTVTIIINAVPTDLLIVTSGRGGVPGSTGKLVPLVLTNLQDIYGIQFTLHFDPAVVKVDSFVPAERINGFNINTNLGDSSNQVTVLVFSLSNEIITSGSDTVLFFALSVDSLAQSGDTPLSLTNAWEAISTDPDIPAKELEVVNGFFTVDKFGDVNLDKQVNIGDVVSLIAYILGNVSLNSRQTDAADINRDGDINVGDLVGVINTILGRQINAPIGTLREPLAYLHLEYDSLQAGSEGKIDLWADLKTSVAGVQLKIKYDPEQLTFSAPKLTSRSNSFEQPLYKDDGNGNLTIVFFRFGKAPITPGEGSILSLPVVTSSNFDKEKIQLFLKEAILADTEAVVIPVEKGEVILPKSFSLSQNYPNPFNPNTTIRFEIGVGGGNQAAVNTTLKVYNILGQVVKTLVNEPKLPGIYYLTWDGKNEQGEKVSSGLYFYQLRAGNYNETKKMVLLK